MTSGLSRGNLSFYQHDAPESFRFSLAGALEGTEVESLEHAWTTASSVLDGKELVVDLSELVSADDAGTRLLRRLREVAARMIPSSRPEARRLMGELALAPPAHEKRRKSLGRQFAEWWHALRAAGCRLG